MENPLSLRLIKEEQESSEKLLELLVSSTHSPKGRFSKENSYIMLKIPPFLVDDWHRPRYPHRKSSAA